MTFKLKANPTFRRVVELKSLDGEVMPLALEMRHRRRSELKAFIEGLPGRSDDEIVADIVAGWFDVDTEFSQEALRDLMEEWACAPGRIWEDYQEAYKEAARKN